MHFLLYGATLIMLATNLTGHTHIDWWLVFTPALIPLAIGFILLAVAVLAAFASAMFNK